MKTLLRTLRATLLAVIVASLCVATVMAAAGSATYTLDGDFDQGVLFNVNHDTPNNNQLQLDQELTTYPVMWVANAGEDTVSKWGHRFLQYPSVTGWGIVAAAGLMLTLIPFVLRWRRVSIIR
ncbi:MAG: hypothetical protein PHU08_05815 [Dehalococcoidales bacterium]|nr:hypothetical protein [Dehalococcoidales bacterium]